LFFIGDIATMNTFDLNSPEILPDTVFKPNSIIPRRYVVIFRMTGWSSREKIDGFLLDFGQYSVCTDFRMTGLQWAEAIKQEANKIYGDSPFMPAGNIDVDGISPYINKSIPAKEFVANNVS